MMNDKIARIVLIIFAIVVMVEIAGFSSLSDDYKCKQKLDQDINIPDTIITSGTLFDDAVEHIKIYEGFRSSVYIDNSGHRTIGYGHHLLKGENHLTVITEKQATDILKSDLQKMIDYVELTTNFKDNKSLSLGLFTYNVGSGTLQKAIDNGLLSDINKLKQYCHYKKSQGDSMIVVTSSKLLERRNYEISLFKL